MAQDVQKLFPELVKADKETGKLEVNYIEMLVLLVAQQKEAIEKLEKRIYELEKETIRTPKLGGMNRPIDKIIIDDEK